jgi:hypothetical protein
MNEEQLSALITRLRDDLRADSDLPGLTLLVAASELRLQADAPDADASALRDVASRCVLRILGATDSRIEKLKLMLDTGRDHPSLDRRQ